MKTKLLLLLMIVALFCSGQERTNTIDRKKQKELKHFAEICKPVYVSGLDTFAVARVPIPENELNKLLINVANDSVEIKKVQDYCFYIVIMVCLEQLKKNGRSYELISDKPNGILSVCIKRMNLSHDNELDFPTVELSTYTVFAWAKKHKNIFKYRRLLKEIKLVETYVKQHYDK